MTSSAIVADLEVRGIHLRAEGGRLAFDAPRGVLTATDRALLREHKAALLAYLSRPRREPDWQALAEMRWGDDPGPGIIIEHPDSARRPAEPDARPACADIRPVDFTAEDCPAFALGDPLDDSLAVRSCDARSADVPVAADALAVGAAIYILRAGGMPEKVEAAEGRRNVDLPGDATHWCREGDTEWTPIRYDDSPRQTLPPEGIP